MRRHRDLRVIRSPALDATGAERARTVTPPEPPGAADGPQVERLHRLLRYLKIFWHWRVRNSLELPYLPEEISIELTNSCNFKCAFCSQSNPAHFDLVPRTMLTPEQARVLLSAVRDAGVTSKVIHWTLDGEPFVNKEFAEIVRSAVVRGFRAHHFASNGYLATPERLHAFPRTPDQSYVLTIDYCSDETYFETYRGTEASWKLVGENIRAIATRPDLANFTVEVTDISSYAIRDAVELDRRFDAMQRLFPERGRISFHRRVFHNMTGFLAESEAKRSKTYHLCPYPWYSLMIASNGDVVACCRDLEHKTVLGNLFQQKLRDIWSGEPYRRLREALVNGRPDDVAACAGCDMPYDATKHEVGYIARRLAHRAMLWKKI